MYPSIHSLAHRAPPATRTRVRWQPYNSLPTSASASSFSSRSPASSSSSSSYLSTPASSPSPTPTLSCESERTKQPQSLNRDPSQKSKYALSLVDQAVKSLSEIWLPQDIPVVFLTSSRASVPGSADNLQQHQQHHHHHHHIPITQHQRNTQLPSPVSPTTKQSPSSSSSSPATSQCNESLEALRNNVPIKGFVHEVLRRSRTSGTVLQTALCYLEAIRPKIPELVRQEKAGQGIKGEPELVSRIAPATEAELEYERQVAAAEGSSGLPTIVLNDSEDVMDTVKVLDDADVTVTESSTSYSSNSGTLVTCSQVPTADDKKPKGPSAPLNPLPPLPSPLLCPRRAFLASLILASKFTQDKCYSNRAWAKLSGLPPREIGRCERALGDALEWRLWVGKSPSSSTASAQASPATKPVTRCQSESNLRSSAAAASSSTFLAVANAAVPTKPLLARSGSGLRRASTLPAEAFASASASSSCCVQRLRSNNVVTQWINSHRNHNIEDSDSDMYSPQVDTEHSTTIYSSSPCPPTPGLSYSPSSTESSSSSGGDRTIQMSSFLDDNMCSFGPLGPSCSTPWSMDHIVHIAPAREQSQHGSCSFGVSVDGSMDPVPFLSSSEVKPNAGFFTGAMDFASWGGMGMGINANAPLGIAGTIV
ncbi:g1 s-specific cyclin [Moniliophthora roreri MCA 2997]|uniref:G1 s-specific cyclin n=1 Tax=Moniliophthora roreri (strain MCA 2997) TaxID=1381753 RepID=V2YXZ8_MONRO|nr:g1 s-specific cyclin [Moniliophthora roreri MCA 2997]